MKERFSLLVLILFFVFVVCSTFVLLVRDADHSTTIVTLDDESVAVSTANNTSPSLSGLSVFSTGDAQEYLKFLEEMNEYDIIDISTGMSVYYGEESYVVTYKKDDSNAESVSYKYYLYKTREQSEYLSFYSSFDFDTYEIVDISTRLDTYYRGESYVITYRKPN